MERIFLILFASACSAFSAALLVKAGFAYLEKLGVEKKFKERSGKISEIYKKGAAWNALFLSGKIGESIKQLPIKRLPDLANDIALQLSILGGDFAKIDAYTFIGLQVLSAIVFIFVSLLVLAVFNIILLLIIGALGFYLPYMWIKEKVKARHKAIFRQIPDVLDMLTLMIEAGLDFNTALGKILTIEKGPLIDEFISAQQEIKLGKSRLEAFETMSGKVKYQPLTQVINSLIIAIKTGGSLAPTLRTLSVQFRVERSQAAEKLASEAPIKLMVPLVLLIFPTIFIILFGPIVLSFLGNK